MDIGQIINRAVQITWRYRALWLFGFLLALFGGGGTGFGGGGGNGGGGGGGGRGNSVPGVPTNLPFDLNEAGRQLQQVPAATWLTIGVLVFLFILVMFVISAVVSNVAKTALIGMVQQIETTGVTSVRDGFRLGWSRHAWRNFLMELVVWLAAFLVAIFVAILIVTLGIGTGAAFTVNTTAGGSMVAVLVLTILLLIPILLVVGFIVSAIQSFASRYIVLREVHVFESLGAGWGLFRANFVNVGLMMLILFALTIVWSVISGILGIVSGGLLGVAVGFGAYALTQSLGAAVLAALPGILLAIVLMSALGGIFVTFREAVWTLMFRNLADRPPQTAPSLAPTPAR